jgi:hypothetical protein
MTMEAPREKVPLVSIELLGMKLRFLEIESWVIDDLPYWTREEIERESEETLKELGISRQQNESYLLAWVRAMLDENGRENTPENRRLVLEAIRQDKRMFPFVWAMGREEAELFGLDDSPAMEEYRARRAADQALMAAFARAPDHSSRQGPPISRSGIAQTVLGLLVVAAGVRAAEGLASPFDWRLADLPIVLVWIGLVVSGAALLLGIAVLVERKPSPLQRLALWVAIAAAFMAVGLHLHASRKLEADAAQRERWALPPTVDKESVEEVGYIQQIKRVDRLWEHTRSIVWFVKIPTTNKLYSCSWESGFAGFAKDDGVKLIHKNSDIETDDYSGFIVGLHGDQAGRSASVWALDTDDLEMFDLDER